MEEKIKDQKIKKSNFKKIMEGVGGGLLVIGGVVVGILTGGNGNKNINKKI